MAKTKTTKRTTKAKQQPVGDMEVTVCRRRGERRQAVAPAAKASTVAASGKSSTVEKAGKKTSKLGKVTAASASQPEQPFKPVIVPGERRKKVPRRRQIDPTTCERDYTGDEIEFMHALDAYKRSSGRMFPTCSEILEVVRGLGYVRVRDGEENAAGGAAKDDADTVARSEAEIRLTR